MPEDAKVVEPEATAGGQPEQTAPEPQPEGQTAQPSVQGDEQTQQPQGQEEKFVPIERLEQMRHEYERKMAETFQSIPTIIEETLKKTSPAVQQKAQEPTIEQLEAFAEQADDVQSKVWAKQKIRELERVEREREYVQLMDAERRRISAETEVINDPRFQDAFVSVNGMKQFNPNSELVKRAAVYVNDPVLVGRPDRLSIAMKLAYADTATHTAGAAMQELAGVKRENAKLKQQTLVDGGVPQTPPARNNVADALSELSKTGSKTALRTLTQAILRQQGVIK